MDQMDVVWLCICQFSAKHGGTWQIHAIWHTRLLNFNRCSLISLVHLNEVSWKMEVKLRNHNYGWNAPYWDPLWIWLSHCKKFNGTRTSCLFLHVHLQVQMFWFWQTRKTVKLFGALFLVFIVHNLQSEVFQWGFALWSHWKYAECC